MSESDIEQSNAVVTFLGGDYAAGQSITNTGFEIRMRFPAKYAHEGGSTLSADEVPEDGYLVSVDIDAQYVHMEDCKAGSDDRFHLVVLFRSMRQAMRQSLTIYGDGEVVAKKQFRPGDVLYRTIDADQIAFKPGAARNLWYSDTGTEQGDQA
jgi:hypothetical protein